MATTIERALVGLIAAAALAAPLSARGSEQSDEGALLSEKPFLLPNSQADDHSNWVKFSTDECGIPVLMQNGRTMLRRSDFDEDLNEPNDDMDAIDDDPSDQAWGIISDLFSTQPEIAVMSDGIEKSCDDDAPLEAEPFEAARKRLDGVGDSSPIAS